MQSPASVEFYFLLQCIKVENFVFKITDSKKQAQKEFICLTKIEL